MKEENTGLQPELTQEEQQEKRNEILQVRREKLDKLQQEGKDPFRSRNSPWINMPPPSKRLSPASRRRKRRARLCAWAAA